jgi:hypothetical protein
MTSPRVIELPRRLEPVSPDTFLGGVVLEFPPPTRRSNVVALRPGDAGVPRQRPATAPPPPPAAA